MRNFTGKQDLFDAICTALPGQYGHSVADDDVDAVWAYYQGKRTSADFHALDDQAKHIVNKLEGAHVGT